MAGLTEGLYKYKGLFAMRNITSLIFTLLLGLFSFQTSFAENSCPGIDSPEAVAIKYKLFTAYQTGFDGYETPCELKCFGNKSCQNSCQSKQGLRLLEQRLQELAHNNNSTKCPSYTIGCLEQCDKLGASCAAVCGQDLPIADKMPASEKVKNKL